MCTSTVVVAEALRLQPVTAMLLNTAAPASGMATSVPLVNGPQPPGGGVDGVEVGVVRRAGGVVHVDVLGRRRPAAVRVAVQRRVVHEAQRPAVAEDVDLLADVVVARV